LNKGASVGEVINIGTGRGVTIGETAKTVLSLIDSKAKVVLDPDRLRPERSEVHRLICDSTKAKAFLGWEPTYTLEQGLHEVIEFMAGASAHSVGRVYAI
jgi:nucleoside-diphosphate-sugar epimerase